MHINHYISKIVLSKQTDIKRTIVKIWGPAVNINKENTVREYKFTQNVPLFLVRILVQVHVINLLKYVLQAPTVP